MTWAKALTAQPQCGGWQPRMGPTASRILSRALLREIEMCEKVNPENAVFDLGIYLKAQVRCQLGTCSCVAAELWWSTVHPTDLHPDKPGTGWGRPWLPTHTPTSSYHEIQREEENGRLLHTLVSPWHSQDVARAIIQAGDLQSTGDYQVALFSFLNIPWKGIFLYKNLLIQALAQKWQDLGFTLTLRDFSASASLSIWASSQVSSKLMREGNVLYIHIPNCNWFIVCLGLSLCRVQLQLKG